MAAEQNKPKIDLKARLGKAPAGGPAGPGPISVAPPGRVGSVAPPPTGSVPPPNAFGAAPAGPSIGVPAPPFGAAKPATDPFGAAVSAASAAPRPAAAATIKIEMDDEVVKAHSRGGKKAAMLAGVTLIIGLGLGFAFGQRSSDAGSAKIAMQGAGDLADEIGKSQAKIKELSDKIGAAIGELKNKKFPAKFAEELAALSIPFSAEKLYGKGIGRFNDRALKLLFSYTQDVEALNDRKDALRNLFSGQAKAITDALASAGNPKVSYAVFVQRSPAHGPVAVLAPIDTANVFNYKDNWPATFHIGSGQNKSEATRWNGDAKDLFTTEKKVTSLPLDPDSVASTFPNDVVNRITSELSKTAVVLTGSGEDEPGILKKGEEVIKELRKIGSK